MYRASEKRWLCLPWLRLLMDIFAIIAILAQVRTTMALPVYSRQYNVPCATCHTVAPRLNAFGYAFQANFFNWPDSTNPPKRDPTSYLPLSTITTFSYRRDITGRQEDTNVRAFEIYASSGFGGRTSAQGGYFVNLLAATTEPDAHPGDLDDAFVSLPLVGRRGQFAVTLGQATPLAYQYDQVNSLTDAIPYAVTEGVDGLAFATSQPLVRLEYFDNRGKESPDGNYLSFGVPFAGHLELTRQGTVGPGTGFFAHAFHRWGFATVGAIGYLHKDSHQGGLIATYSPRRHLYLTGFATLAHGDGLNTTHVTAEAEFTPTRFFAVTARAELISGDLSELASVASLTYYPFKSQYFRLTAEERQRRQDRGFTLFVRFQY